MIGDILQPTHLIFVLVVALLVLGPKRLPEAGRSLGRGLRDFKDALSGDSDDRDLLLGNEVAPAATAQAAPPTEDHVAAPAPPVAPVSPVAATPAPAPAPAPGAPPEPAPVGAPGYHRLDNPEA